MDVAETWRSLFENWPEAIPRNGLVVTTFQETIPFINFMVSRGALLVERDKPDGVGARKVIIAYAAIAAIKLPHTLDLPEFQVLGFQPPS